MLATAQSGPESVEVSYYVSESEVQKLRIRNFFSSPVLHFE